MANKEEKFNKTEVDELNGHKKDKIKPRTYGKDILAIRKRNSQRHRD